MIFNLNDLDKPKLISLLEQHEKNIDYLIYLSDIIWEKSVDASDIDYSLDCSKKRDFLFEKLSKEKPYPNKFVDKNIAWDTQMLRLEDYLANPYLKALNNLSFSKDGWVLKQKILKAYSLFPYEEEYHYAPNYLLKMNLAFFDKDYSYPSLSLYDQEWMSLNPYEIRTMEMPLMTVRGKVLVLGLGLGYFAYMAHLKEEVKEVYVVEMDLELIKVFNEYLLPLFPHKEKIHIIKADAFHFIEVIKDKDYDSIFSDLWHDVGDGLSAYLKLRKKFNEFKYTQCTYWIEGAIITYLRLLVIAVMRDEFYHIENEYDEFQLLIKERTREFVIKNTNDLDTLLNIGTLQKLFLK